MNFDRIKEILEKVPVTIILILYLGYLGFDYYAFENDASSPKLIKQKEIAALKDVNNKLGGKLKELTQFVKTLEQKKIELRGLARELQDLKATITEDIDVPGFMKMVTTEAKKLNLTVLGLKPTGTDAKEFYGEVKFSLAYRGIFIQLVGFLERLSNLSRIIQIDKFNVNLKGSNSVRFVMLEGELELKVFKYIASHEDTLGKSEDVNNSSSTSATSTTLPSSAPASGKVSGVSSNAMPGVIPGGSR